MSNNGRGANLLPSYYLCRAKLLFDRFNQKVGYAVENILCFVRRAVTSRGRRLIVAGWVIEWRDQAFTWGSNNNNSTHTHKKLTFVPFFCVCPGRRGNWTFYLKTVLPAFSSTSTGRHFLFIFLCVCVYIYAQTRICTSLERFACNSEALYLYISLVVCVCNASLDLSLAALRFMTFLSLRVSCAFHRNLVIDETISFFYSLVFPYSFIHLFLCSRPVVPFF